MTKRRFGAGREEERDNDPPEEKRSAGAGKSTEKREGGNEGETCGVDGGTERGEKKPGENEEDGEEADRVCEYYRANEEERQHMMERIQRLVEGEEMKEEGTPKKRRYSDQFRHSTSDLLYMEKEKNRRAKVLQKFKREHGDVEKEISRWKGVVIACSVDLIKEGEGNASEFYRVFGLEKVGITEEEMGIE
jgi:Putative double-strand recombination repair-like